MGRIIAVVDADHSAITKSVVDPLAHICTRLKGFCERPPLFTTPAVCATDRTNRFARMYEDIHVAARAGDLLVYSLQEENPYGLRAQDVREIHEGGRTVLVQLDAGQALRLHEIYEDIVSILLVRDSGKSIPPDQAQQFTHIVDDEGLLSCVLGSIPSPAIV